VGCSSSTSGGSATPTVKVSTELSAIQTASNN
jgi:hypothetical protein